jgi:hypothetical protein
VISFRRLNQIIFLIQKWRLQNYRFKGGAMRMEAKYFSARRLQAFHHYWRHPFE